MPDAINRRCPQCGRKAHDRLLVQCPDCHVPFVLDEAVPTTLTPEHMRLLAAQVFGSWKFWAVILLVVGGAAWATVTIADKLIDSRAKTYLGAFQEQATNQLRATAGQISNQIVQEFRQPRIQRAIEDAARTRAAEIITNGVRPSLESLLDAMDAAASQLSKSTNTIAQLERDALDAQKRIPQQVSAPVETSNPPPVVATPVPQPAPAVATNPSPDTNTPLKLSLGNHTVLPVPGGSNYLLTVMFKVNNSSAGGSVMLEADTYSQTANIMSFQASGSTANPVFNTASDAARLQFNVVPGIAPVVMIELTGPTIVRLVSDSMDSEVTIPVAADKLKLPSATRN